MGHLGVAEVVEATFIVFNLWNFTDMAVIVFNAAVFKHSDPLSLIFLLKVLLILVKFGNFRIEKDLLPYHILGVNLAAYTFKASGGLCHLFNLFLLCFRNNIHADGFIVKMFDLNLV